MDRFSPSWASEITSRTPFSPRATRLRRNPSQNSYVSAAPTSNPRTSRSPVSRTPTAITAAQFTTRPSCRTFIPLASSHT